MVDRAYWDPALLTAAQQTNSNAVNVYAWDHYLKDINGYCGGYTPDVVAQVYAAGYDVHFTFCFRDGEAPLDPATCVAILRKLGARPGAWVHNDIEGGAMDSLAHNAALTQAVKAAGFRSAPYGLPSTLRGGYLQGADGAWVASYVLPWDQPPALVNVPNVGAWDYIGWQYSTTSPPAIDVDVSVHSFPPAGSTPQEEPLVAPTQLKVAILRLAWLSALGREPVSATDQLTFTGMVGQVADDLSNVDAVVTQITDSAEAQARRSASASTTIPPHTHVPGPVS